MSVKYAQIMRHLDGCCGTYAPTYITHQPRKKGGEEKRSEKALSNADSRSAFQTSTKNKATYFKIGKKYVVAIVLKKIYKLSEGASKYVFHLNRIIFAKRAAPYP